MKMIRIDMGKALTLITLAAVAATVTTTVATIATAFTAIASTVTTIATAVVIAARGAVSGLVDTDATAVQVLVVHGGNGTFGVLVLGKGDEAKATAAAYASR